MRLELVFHDNNIVNFNLKKNTVMLLHRLDVTVVTFLPLKKLCSIVSLMYLLFMYDVYFIFHFIVLLAMYCFQRNEDSLLLMYIIKLYIIYYHMPGVFV